MVWPRDQAYPVVLSSLKVQTRAKQSLMPISAGSTKTDKSSILRWVKVDARTKD